MLVLACLLWLAVDPLQAADPATIKAVVLDVAGNPVTGAKIFVYDSADTRRPADFISPMSDRGGRVVLQVPPGRYWVVARLKKDGTYGPLMPGDKHSGEPATLEPAAGEELASEFVVADIRDVGRKKQTVAAESIILRGRIVDGSGEPVANAYVFAARTKQVGPVPEFLSAWSDSLGNYTLYLPTAGRYVVGAAAQFPPPRQAEALRDFVSDSGTSDFVMDVTLAVQ
ncbi:MAG: carboxypeptidase regulatory-like domain-containing protein [Desulfuromonadales bacterium]|nr:MAG: carboxypeptidase regulatory-like domain-containing protein [Desulfuromonadales bacterium]